MPIILSPTSVMGGNLREVYDRAFARAEELYIASAYLTDWRNPRALNPRCKRVTFLVGTDFGLTRRAAIRAVLKWIPKRGVSFIFKAVGKLNGGFHPKVLAWKTPSGHYYCTIGSSNLSEGAFASNYEANVVLPITKSEFDRLRDWLRPLLRMSETITEDWADNHYKEATLINGRPDPQNKIQGCLTFAFPNSRKYQQAVQYRREQQNAFRQIAEELEGEIRRCARGDIAESIFWQRFWDLWSRHESRFQGGGLQISCKSAPWKKSCESLVRILDSGSSYRSAPEERLDAIVSCEIDRLAAARNPTRGAWLSEMLCHFFPELYPVRNFPIRKWLAYVKWRSRRGSSEGQRYTELAWQLRDVLRTKPPSGAKNLAELDAVIWEFVQDRKL